MWQAKKKHRRLPTHSKHTVAAALKKNGCCCDACPWCVCVCVCLNTCVLVAILSSTSACGFPYQYLSFVLLLFLWQWHNLIYLLRYSGIWWHSGTQPMNWHSRRERQLLFLSTIRNSLASVMLTLYAFGVQDLFIPWSTAETVRGSSIYRLIWHACLR